MYKIILSHCAALLVVACSSNNTIDSSINGIPPSKLKDEINFHEQSLCYLLKKHVCRAAIRHMKTPRETLPHPQDYCLKDFSGEKPWPEFCTRHQGNMSLEAVVYPNNLRDNGRIYLQLCSHMALLNRNYYTGESVRDCKIALEELPNLYKQVSATK